MFRSALIVLLLAVAAVVAYVVTRPDEFRVARSIRIAAAPQNVHALIADFTQWPRWSPYEHRDPAMKRTLGATTKGRGAVYSWDGNNEVGAGRMEILDDSPARIVIQLDFIRPFEGHNIAEFVMSPSGSEVEVTWAMSGPAKLVTKLMGLVVDMDKMIGRDFEAGLANLKSESEKN